MALTKQNYLDKTGVQSMATAIFKQVATDIGKKDTELEGKIDAAKSELEGKITALTTAVGTSEDEAGAESVYGAFKQADEDLKTQLQAVKQTADTNKTNIGTSGDTSSQNTVYGAIKKAEETINQKINSLTHLTIQTITGDIDSTVEEESRKEDVIYLQRDSEEDTSWLLYIWDADGGEASSGAWICIGDTNIDLSGYQKNDDDSLAALQARLIGSIPDGDITEAVSAGYTAATTPVSP